MSYFLLACAFKNLRTHAVSRSVFRTYQWKIPFNFKLYLYFSVKERQFVWLDCFVDNQLKGMESFIFPLRKLFVYLITKHNFANTMIRVNNYSINKNFVKLHHHQKPRHRIYDGIIFFERCCLLYFPTFFLHIPT